LRDGHNYRVTHIDDIVPNLSPFGSYVQTQPNYFISSGNNIDATAISISRNTDPQNFTPTASFAGLVFNTNMARDRILAAHSRYINLIDACGGVTLPPVIISRAVDTYIDMVMNGTVTPYARRY
jgi:hypothetical protein